MCFVCVVNVLDCILFARDRQGPAWTGSEVFENLGDTKDYLGIIFPIAIAAVGLSLMALVSAEAAGTTNDANVKHIILSSGGWAVRVLGVSLAVAVEFEKDRTLKKNGLACIPLFMLFCLFFPFTLVLGISSARKREHKLIFLTVCAGRSGILADGNLIVGQASRSR